MTSIDDATKPGPCAIVISGGGFGVSATTGPDSPGGDEKRLASARDLGRRVAEIAAVVKRGARP